METILYFTVIIAVGVIIYSIYRYFTASKMIENNELFSQNDITIEYAKETIKIKKHTFKVNQVTGISIITEGRAKILKIDVDDLRHPVLRVVYAGSEHGANQFMQRICVALRKANGPSFI